MDIELKKIKKLEHALCDAIDILHDWQVEEVKPEEERFIAYLARPKYRDCYLTACAECMWEVVQKEFDAKTKLFVGTCDEAVKWYEPREKFTEIIKAWEDGNRIQVTPKGTDKWLDLHCAPTWDIELEYRVKSDCPCEDGIDSKACVGCEHSEDGKKKYRPYESSAEMIVDFFDRFKVKCPSYCEPMIWLKGHNTDNRYLVTSFPSEFGVSVGDRVRVGGALCSFLDLFKSYTYLDGNPCGKEC